MNQSQKRDKKNWLRLASIPATLVLLAQCTQSKQHDEPGVVSFDNLIVVMVDTMRSDYLSSYGGDKDSGQFLTRLADQSIQIQGYSASSWTRPSVATLLTGLYPQRHQVLGRDDALASSPHYLPQILRDFGVQTAAMVTNGNVSQLFGFSRGFDLFRLEIGAGKPTAELAVTWSLELAEQLRPPFFYYIHLMDPHTPYLPKTVPGEPELRRRDLFQPQQLLRGEVDFTEANVARLRRQYQGEIRELDSELERLVTGLETMGRLENTLLVITSDHGEEFNEHGGLAHGSTLFEEVLRVPMILWAKSGTPAYQSDLAFHQVDFTPTMLEAMGLPLPDDMDGLSRWRDLLNENLEPPMNLLFHLDLGDARFVALSQGPRKIVRDLVSHESMIFDLSVDPGEQQDIAGATSELNTLEDELQRLVRDLEERRFDAVQVEPTYTVKEQLEALGYLGGN